MTILLTSANDTLQLFLNRVNQAVTVINNLTDGTLYVNGAIIFTNSTFTLTLQSANVANNLLLTQASGNSLFLLSSNAVINGTAYLTGPGTALSVANNATVNGNVTISTGLYVKGIEIGTGLASISNAGNAAFLEANSFQSVINTSYAVANSGQNLALSAFGEANSFESVINTSYATANAAFAAANSAVAAGNIAFIQAAFNQANAGTFSATFAYGRANAAYTQANAAFSAANLAWNTANSAVQNTGGVIVGTIWDSANVVANNLVANNSVNSATIMINPISSTAAYKLSLKDSGTVISFNVASNVSVQTTNTLPIGFRVVCTQMGAGNVNFSLANNNIFARGVTNYAIIAQYGSASLVCIDTNKFILSGEIN